jgi:hypothetical protein
MLVITGIALSELSIVSVVFAPEGLLVEGGGVEAGASLMQLGGLVTTLGLSLNEYLENGDVAAGKEAGLEVALDIDAQVIVSNLFPGIGSGVQESIAAIVGQIPNALTKAGACAN